MAEEKIAQDFRLKNIDEARNYLMEEINQKELLMKNRKNNLTTLNCMKRFLILDFKILVFASLVGNPIGIMSSAIGLKICLITTTINKYKSITKKKKKNHDKIVLLGKLKSNNM